jgi:hypothetical protein
MRKLADPDRDELLAFINASYSEVDAFDCEEAIYWFAANWHGGQASNLYSALSTSEFRPSPTASNPEEGSLAEAILVDLQNHFYPIDLNANPECL